MRHMALLSDSIDLWFTMGPESRNPLSVRRIIESGATGVRLGFSFGTHQLQTQRVEMVRSAAKAVKKPFTIIADLPGEKIRLGDFGGINSVTVEAGDTIELVPSPETANVLEGVLPVDETLLQRVSLDARLVIGDGAVQLTVTESNDTRLICNVEVGGTIDPNRGVVVQGDEFEPDSLTKADKRSLRYVSESGLYDGVAISFVTSAEDVNEARKIVESNGKALPIVAKIESKNGVENADEICQAADVIMVARGDLAQFLPWSELGIHTNQIVRAAERTEVPWILATQVAEGLERFSFPTRAEICDLTHWVQRDVDGVLLSYETAFGSAPVKTTQCTREVLNTVDEARPSDKK